MNSFLKLWNLKERPIGRSRTKIFVDECNEVYNELIIFFHLLERKI